MIFVGLTTIRQRCLFLLGFIFTIVLCGPISDVGVVTGDEEIDEENAREIMLRLLGHAQKPVPNVYNIMTGASEDALAYMFDLYKDVVNHDYTHNHTNIEVTKFSGKLEVRYNNDDDNNDGLKGKRTKRTTVTTADTAISFITENRSARPNATDAKESLYFDLRTDYDTSSIVFAELRLHFLRKVPQRKLTVFFYQVVQKKTYKLISKKVIGHDYSSQWITINITKLVTTWSQIPSQNHGLFIRIRDEVRNEFISMNKAGITANNSKEKKHRPFIVVFIESLRSPLLADKIYELLDEATDDASDTDDLLDERPRSRREIDIGTLMDTTDKSGILNDKKEPRGEGLKFNKTLPPKPCRVSSFRIDFHKLNWGNWIVAPTSYDSQFCAGSCSFPIVQSQNATSHSMIQSLHSLITGGEFPQPCCAPTEMSPLHVFLLDTFGNPVIKQYANMRVDSCGCQ